MSNIVISVENLSKAYRLGQIGTGTLSHDINVWWAKVRGKPNPLLKIGQDDHSNRDGETIWAINDINFEVQQGEVLGIIGRNGAGKSTLLKILSRVTAPTSGQIKVKGRIASLLEVGTGFHPELTGQENIYLNGAILGMNRKEINRKFDEIVAFAEIQEFIDTPVKRYSSGMYVRLAFAVAAHLDPEILLVDEVLAVGDIAFQKKCLSKMQDIGQGGRTVLFVSHNMAAISRLCQRVLLINQGKIETDGQAKQVVARYLQSDLGTTAEKMWSNLKEAPGNDIVRMRSIRIVDVNMKTTVTVDVRNVIGIEINFEILKNGCPVVPNVSLYNDQGIHILNAIDTNPVWEKNHRQGNYISVAWLPANLLNEGTIIVSALLVTMSSGSAIRQATAYEAVSFQVFDPRDGDTAKGSFSRQWGGAVSPLLEWTIDVVA